MRSLFLTACLATALLFSTRLIAGPPTPTTPEQCTAQGGLWDPVHGRGHVTGCNLPAKTAGKACRDSSECPNSPCVHDHCYEYQHYRGCGITVKEAGVRRELCAD